MNAVSRPLSPGTLRAVLICVVFTSLSLMTPRVCGTSTSEATTLWSTASSLDTGETATLTGLSGTLFTSAMSDFSVGDANATGDIATTTMATEENSTDISNTTDFTTAISNDTFEELNFTTTDMNTSEISTSALANAPTATAATLSTVITTKASPSPTGSTTTTEPPLEYIRCERTAGRFVPVGVNTNMQIVSRGIVKYTCLDGFRENGTGSSEIRCNPSTKTWQPATALVCVPIERTYPEPTTAMYVDLYPGVPDWIPALLVTVLVIVVLAWILLLTLLLYVCRRRQAARTSTIKQHVRLHQQEEITAPTVKPAPPQGREASPGWRCWARKRSPRRPPGGYLGLDGVALTIKRDNYLLPVKKRF